MTTTKYHSRIKSFVRRKGRITAGQQRALAELSCRYGLDPGVPLDVEGVLKCRGKLIVEIGFGAGENLLAAARAQPENNFIGIEVYDAGVGQLMLLLAKHEVENVRILQADAVEVLAHAIPNNSIDVLQIFFPDPWPKKRHHKRRLIQPEFVSLACSKLKQGGVIHLATDWEHYAYSMLEMLSHNDQLMNMAKSGDFWLDKTERTKTKFEARGESLGHSIWELKFCREKTSAE